MRDDRSRPKRRSKERDAPNNMACSMEKAATSDEVKEPWRVLPLDIQDLILSKLPYKHLFQAKVVSKWFNNHISSDEFRSYRGSKHPEEASLTALHFSSGAHGVWQCCGYDLTSKSWKKLPPFHMLPRLDPTLFKDHLICGAGGVMCANLSTHERIKVFNPLTGRLKELPYLNHPRNPVLMHMILDSAGGSYRVVVAGSAKAGHEHLSKVTEIYDSCSGIWTVAEELPGPLYAVNEHQTGMYRDGILYCIAFLEGEQDVGKGVLAFSVDERRWLPQLSCPLSCPTNLNIVQLVDINGEIAVFAEIEPNPYIRSVEHRIDILEDVVVSTCSGQRRGKWRNVMSETKVGSQAGLQVYPEYACVPFGEGKVCIFNTIVHTGIVYDVQSGKRIETLPSPTWRGEMGFYSMNALTFTFEPSFKGKP